MRKWLKPGVLSSVRECQVRGYEKNLAMKQAIWACIKIIVASEMASYATHRFSSLVV